MLKNKLLPLVFGLLLTIADFNPAFAFPVGPNTLALGGVSHASDIVLARGGRGGGGRGGYAGRGGMGVNRGGYGYRGGAGVARRGGYGYRGYGYRGGAAYRGYGVNRAAVARHRIGGRYYGGVWYGTGRRYWRGRWWPYGVGSCWRRSPVGYVWICG